MPTVVERIQYVVEATTGQAKKSFTDLKADMASAGTVGDKVKAGIGGIGKAVKDNMVLGLAGAGTAITGFVGKAIGDFQQLALEADKTSAATGLSVQDASRWIEVTGDLGVNMDTVATAVNRLNKEAGQGKLAEFGINASDANGRLLQTLQYLQSIPDEATRAKVATELLGKSWTELAPLVQQAGNLKQQLADVSDAKVIDPAEVEKAKRFRDAMDNLNDVFEDFSLTVGEAVVPALSNLADLLKKIDDLGIPKIFEWGAAGGNVFEFTKNLLMGAIHGDSPKEMWHRLFGGGGKPDLKDQGWGGVGFLMPGQLGATGTIPGTVVVNNFPPGTSPRTTNESLEDWYRRNGGRP